jgi:tetratricopeptide (TPR) repeat protein
MVGSSQLAIKDTVAAIKTFQDAVEVFKKSYNSSIEGIEALKAGEQYQIDAGQLSYITQTLGILHQSQGQYKEALAAINTGLELLPGDEDIARVKLHIYQQTPELFAEAKKKFETAIADNPEDVNLKMAYAELLSKNGEDDEAKGLYDRVYEQDPNNFMANYGKGAYYINKAAKISDAIMKLGTSSDDEWKTYQMNDEIVELLKKAYTYMKWLHENDPKNAEWLRQLVNITPIIGKDDETADYAKKLGELNQ